MGLLPEAVRKFFVDSGRKGGLKTKDKFEHMTAEERKEWVGRMQKGRKEKKKAYPPKR